MSRIPVSTLGLFSEDPPRIRSPEKPSEVVPSGPCSDGSLIWVPGKLQAPGEWALAAMTWWGCLLYAWTPENCGFLFGFLQKPPKSVLFSGSFCLDPPQNSGFPCWFPVKAKSQVHLKHDTPICCLSISISTWVYLSGLSWRSPHTNHIGTRPDSDRFCRLPRGSQFESRKFFTACARQLRASTTLGFKCCHN